MAQPTNRTEMMEKVRMEIPYEALCFINTFIDRETGLCPMLYELDSTFRMHDIFDKLAEYYNNETTDAIRQLYAPEERAPQAHQVQYGQGNMAYILQDTTQKDLSGDAMGYRAAHELDPMLAQPKYSELKPTAAVLGRQRVETIPTSMACASTSNQPDFSFGVPASGSYMRAIQWDGSHAGSSTSTNLVEQALMQAPMQSTQLTLQPPTFHPLDHSSALGMKRDHRGDIIKAHGIKQERDLGLIHHANHTNRSSLILQTPFNTIKSDYQLKHEPVKFKSDNWKEAVDLLKSIKAFINCIESTTCRFSFSAWINAETSAKPDQKPVKTAYRRFGDALDIEYKRLYGEDEAKRQGKLERKHRMKIWKEVEGTMIEVKYRGLELESLVKACEEPVNKMQRRG